MTVPIVINGRFQVHRVTGMQRYAREVVRRLGVDMRIVTPERNLRGLAGHAWEQAVLPLRLDGGLLWSPCGTGPLAATRQVVTIHDVIPIDYPQWYSAKFSLLHRALVPRLARRVRRVVTVSEYTRSRLVERFRIPDEKITVIPNGVGEEFRPRSQDEIAEARHKLGIPSPDYVLSLNSLVPRKNVPALLRAWARVLPSLPPSFWLVVAGGSASGTVSPNSDLPSSPERVIFTGYLPDELLPPLYSGATSFVFPSLCEGFGLPVLEAMACGTPVVTSDGSSLSEIGRGAAVLVDPFSVDSIAAGIGRLISDPDLRAALACAGRDRARRYTWSRCADLTRAVLLEESQNIRGGRAAAFSAEAVER